MRCRFSIGTVPEGSVSKLDTVGDGIKVMSTIFRMIREYKPLPFFGGLGAILGIIGIVLCGSVTVDFWHTGMVARFPTLIGAVMLVIAGILLFISGNNPRRHGQERPQSIHY